MDLLMELVNDRMAVMMDHMEVAFQGLHGALLLWISICQSLKDQRGRLH